MIPYHEILSRIPFENPSPGPRRCILMSLRTVEWRFIGFAAGSQASPFQRETPSIGSRSPSARAARPAMFDWPMSK